MNKIKSEQVPDEVAAAFKKSIISANATWAEEAIAAAALAAWPGVAIRVMPYDALALPLAQEPSNE